MVRTLAFVLSLAAIPAALSSPAPEPVRAATARAAEWEIGPIVRGRSLSPGMPATPRIEDGRAVFDIPSPTPRAGHVHYVTRTTGPLTGARRIVLRYRIEGVPGVRILSQEDPGLQGELTLYFQRRGDNWTARGRYGTYRWYAPAATMMPLTPGTHEVVVPLDAEWKSVHSATRSAAPEAFADALANAGRVGFVLGSSGGRGHGVFATAPARFTILDFRVE